MTSVEPLSVQDATCLHVEDDVTPMHVGGAAILEGPPPDRDELLARFAGKLHLVPRYRQKVQFLPLHLGTPAWVDDPHFNLDVLAGGIEAGLAELLELSREGTSA